MPFSPIAPGQRRSSRFWTAVVVAVTLCGGASGQTWQSLPDMRDARYAHTATLLPTGEVLIAGGRQLFQGAAAPLDVDLRDTELFGADGTFRPGPRLLAARSGHTATLLPQGSVLVVGGSDTPSAEMYDPVQATFRALAPPQIARRYHTATLLPDGRVVVAGGADDPRVEVFDPSDESWSEIAGAQLARRRHTATLLGNGDILFVGGTTSATPTLYDASDPGLATTRHYSAATSQIVDGPLLNFTRLGHTATRLHDGTVLVAGGTPIDSFAGGELLDPSLLPGGSWALTASYNTTAHAAAALLPSGALLVAGGGTVGATDEWNGGPMNQSALYQGGSWQSLAITISGTEGTGRLPTLTLLPSGKVLLLGGVWGGPFSELVSTSPSAWLFDPEWGWDDTSWVVAPNPLTQARFDHTQTVLPSGDLLLVSDAQAEVVQDVGGVPQATATATLHHPRRGHTATLLATPDPSSGAPRVLIAGGADGVGAVRTTEIYLDASSSTFVASGSLLEDRTHHSATLLPSGEVLLAGGAGNASAEVFDADTGTSRPTGSMSFARSFHRAFLLPGGEVLVTGGRDGRESELYDPTAIDPVSGALGAWRLASPNRAVRQAADGPMAAAVLPTNEPIVAGSTPDGVFTTQSEVWDSIFGWLAAGGVGGGGLIPQTRMASAGVALPNGLVFVSEGIDPGLFYLLRDTFFDAQTYAWKDAKNHGIGVLNSFRMSTLGSRWIVRTGGLWDERNALPLSPLDTLDVRDLQSAGVAAPTPLLASVNGSTSEPLPPLRYDQPNTVGVTRPAVTFEGSGGGASSSASDQPLLRLRGLETGLTYWLPRTGADTSSDPVVYSIDALPDGMSPGWYELTALAGGVYSAPRMVRLDCSIDLRLADAKGQLRSGDLSLSFPVGDPVTLRARPLGATSVQWQQCSSGACSLPGDWTDIPGATQSSFTSAPLTPADAGTRFRLRASNACTMGTSAVVTVRLGFFTDGFESGDLSAWSSSLP